MIPYDIPQPIVLIWLFVFGAVIGSFLNVCIYRIPKHEKLWDQLSGLNHPPSACPYCQKRILAVDNVPVLGWLCLRGRCRFCRHSIPIRYALIELFNGLLWVLLYVAIVPAGYSAKIESSAFYSTLGALGQKGLTHQQLTWLVNLEYAYFLVMAEALLVATFIDLDLMIIPDGVTIPGALVGLVGACVLGMPTLWPAWFFSQQELNGLQAVLPKSLLWLIYLPERIAWLSAHPHWHGLINSLLGLMIGGGSVWLVRIVGYWAFRREAMGFGDVTLMAMVGSYLGWQPSLIVFLLLAPIGALIVTAVTFSIRSAREIPFGPYLSVGAVILVVFWRSWFSRFETFFSRGPLMLIIFLMMALLLFPMLALMRWIRQKLGYKEESPWIEEWTSGDQLAFYANKTTQVDQSSWQSSDWPGISSGQGVSHTNRWRHGG